MLPEEAASSGAVSGLPGRLDVVVVSFETPDLLDSCLDAATTMAGVGDVVVVDNSHSDGCADVVREYAGVRLVRPGANLGFGAGANIGVAACSTDTVVLNADARLADGALEALSTTLRRWPRAAVIGPRLVDEDGRLQPSCARFPTAGRLIVHQTGLWKLFARTPLRARAQPFFDRGTESEVPWVLGAALLVRREAFLAVGGFDPAFFMYFEEVDLCRRLADRGWSTVFTPTATVSHVGGASTRRDPGAMQREMYRSVAAYMRRHRRDPGLLRLRAAVCIIVLIQVLTDMTIGPRDAARGSRTASARSRLSILADVWRGWPERLTTDRRDER
jgi:N-acetylglucosaminyl-diphospho-decaprenol L-rhamnosyltransferase